MAYSFKNNKSWLISIIGMLCCFYSFAQPVADFDVLIKKGCSPLEVTFINNSIPATGLTYQWILGNGNTSALFEPYAIYINSGTYTVTLIVSDGFQSDTIIKQNFLTVFQNPIADFQVANQHNGCIPLNIKINNLTMLGDTSISTWSWDFGDGYISNDSAPEHVYTFAGTFNLSLLVIDNNGCSGNIIMENYIEAYNTTASFYVDQNQSCTGELLTTFTNLSTGSGTLEYLWNFGDGNTSTEINPVYNYTSSGIFSVTLIATDIHGCSDTYFRANYISIIGVVASFSLPNDTACRNDLIHFTNTSVNAISYNWNFGDSSVSNLFNPSHVYNSSGDFIIQLIVYKSGTCVDTSSFLLHIDQIEAGFTASKNYTCELPLYIQYANNSVNAVSWDWRFGSGHISHLQNPQDSILFLSTTSGSQVFSDTLIAYSPYGCRDIKIIDSSIIVHIPVAVFTPNNMVDDLEGCIPLTFNFINHSNYSSDYDSIVSWNWAFSEGHTSNNWNVSNTYFQTGAFKVTLSFITALGCSAEFSDSVFAGSPQHPYFIINSSDSICASESADLINLSYDQNLIDNYFWFFSDGTTLTAPNPTVQFVDTGYVSGTLTTVYNGCESSYTDDSLVYIKGPYVSFEFNYSCDKPLEYTFNGLIVDAETYRWGFGDQTPDVLNVPQVVHTFTQSGDYSVVLYAENNTNGCTYQTSNYVFVREIKAEFSMSTSLGCAGTEISFDGSASRDVDYFSFNNFWIEYLWYFSDNGEFKYPNPTVNHKFTTNGNHDVSLIVEDKNGCRDTLTKSVNIYQPNVNFSSDYEQGCIPVSFNFTNLTVSDTTITDWLWSFGDSTFSTEQNPVHTYQNFGLYTISLWATDTLGCDTGITKTGFINVQKPDPSFLSNDNTLCVGAPATFFENSQSEIVTYFWNFGDGATSVEASPNHAYSDSGHYSVSLHIVDSHGCDSTGIKPDFVHVQSPPQANFTTNVFSTNCYPAHIYFTDSSVSNYLNSWSWSFGDNFTASQIQNPIHTYFKPGTYNISLIATTTYGCSDTITKNSFITIGGPWANILHPDTICRWNTATLIASEKINVYSLKWDLGNGSSATQDTASTVYTTFGNVYPSVLLHSDSNNTCDIVITDTINVYRVIANFTVNNNDFDGCVPLNILCADLSENAKHYSWFIDNIFSSALPQMQQTLNTSGNHSVTIIINNDFICYDTITKNITVFPLPNVGISADTLICRGSGAQLNASGGVVYSWYPETGLNNSAINNPMASPDSSTTYTVTVKDINNCIKDTSAFISVFQVPKVVFRDTSIVVGEMVQLNATNQEIITYNWSPNFAISCTDCPNPIVMPLESTVYTVAITDTNNCFTVDYQVVIDIMKKYSVDVPDVFTPNGDGLNDIAYVRGWGIKELLGFRIFNRFGEMVFESEDLLLGWNGTYKGANQNTETFTYIVRVKSYNDEIISKKGFIKLIR